MVILSHIPLGTTSEGNKITLFYHWSGALLVSIGIPFISAYIVRKKIVERNFAEYSNLDSLGFVKLIVSLNEKFNIELDTELVLECDNIIQISNYIKGLITGKN